MNDAETPNQSVFFSVKTLLDSAPDVNRRWIGATATLDYIAELNREMEIWTIDHQAALMFLMNARDVDSLRRRVEIIQRTLLL